MSTLTKDHPGDQPDRRPDGCLTWIGPSREAWVPQDVGTCPGCGGELFVTALDWCPYTGIVDQVEVSCGVQGSSRCLPGVLEAPRIHYLPTHPAVLAEAAAVSWAFDQLRVLCYIRLQ